jgi:hypothetical protein
LLVDAGFLYADVVRAVAPGVGLLHFAGSTQVGTSSLIVNADITNATIDIAAKSNATGTPSSTTVLFGNNTWGTIAAGGGGVNAQTISYTLLSTDAGKVVTENGSSLTTTLPASPSATFASGIKNLNSTPLIIARNGNTINGGTSNITLTQYQDTACYAGSGDYVCGVPYVAGTGIGFTAATNGITIAVTGYANLVNATSPGAGFAKFAGSTQTVISAAILASELPNVNVLISTTGAVTDPGNSMDYQFNNASGALTFNVPVGVAGLQRCYRNATGKSGAITLQMATSNTVDVAGANGSSAGTLVSGGALGDSVCLVSDAANHWYAYKQLGTWTNN